MIPVNHFEALFELKWKPFLSNEPASSLYVDDQVSQFCWRVEQLLLDGGYALNTGEPGSGNSIALRELHKHFGGMPELCVKTLARPVSPPI